MKDKYFNDALNCIDSDIVDEFIRESEKIEKKKRVRGAFLQYGTVAACFCIIVSIAIVLANLYPIQIQPPIIPTEGTSQGGESDITTNGNGGINLPPNPTDEDYLQVIYEVYSSYYDSERNFNHKNVINNSARISVDENAPLTKTVTINGLNKELNYENTLYYPVEDFKVHCYLVNGQEDCKVLIREDGSIDSILYDFDKIDILQNNTPEEVFPKIKKIVAQYVDISKYKYIDMPYDSSKDEGGVGFGTYTFVFYNLVDGYRTDSLRIGVDYIGNVYALRINDLSQPITDLNIDKKLEQEMLELKFRDIYTTDTIDYISYEIDDRFFPQVVTREDGIYIQYAGSAKYAIKDTGEERKSYLVDVLIPLELIISK